MPPSRTPAVNGGRPPKAVRVWAECGITLAVSEDPPQYVKFSFGHERIAPNDDLETIRRTEAEVYEFCERVVARRIRSLRRLVRAG